MFNLNKLRTKISQFELSESFDSIHESPEYQKTRMFLDCINQEIMEREEQVQESEKTDSTWTDKSGKKHPATKVKGDKYTGAEAESEERGAKRKDLDDLKGPKMKSESYITSTIRQRGNELSVPEQWIDSAIARMELGESDKDELKAELAIRYDINESTASWMLLEGEEDKAETIMATKDMVDRITGWLEDVAAMKAEQLLELQDAIREQQGSDVAQQYTDAVKPALEAIYATLETSRQGLTSGLSIVSGEGPDTMGAPAGGELGGVDLGEPEETPEPAMGGAPAAPEAAGREKRESIDYSRRLGMLLAQSKKK
jgi:hypothetical protein